MKFQRLLPAAALLGCLGLSACVALSRFDWSGYDGALYAYSKHPDQLPAFERTLQDAITRGHANGRLAPGLEAELGYLYLGEGKRADAIEEFKAEMADFPESRTFLSKIIAQTAG